MLAATAVGSAALALASFSGAAAGNPVRVVGGPASVTATTSAGTVRLLLRHSCWLRTVSPVGGGAPERQVVCSPPGLDAPRHALPSVRARPGEVVTFSLPFKPTKAEVVLSRESAEGGERVATFRFRPRRVLRWRAPSSLTTPAEGLHIGLSLGATRNQSAYYVGRLTIVSEPTTTAPLLVSSAGEHRLRMASMTWTFPNGVGHADGAVVPLAPVTVRAGELLRVRLAVDPTEVRVSFRSDPPVTVAPAREIVVSVPESPVDRLVLVVIWRDDHHPRGPATVRGEYYLPIVVTA